MPHSTNKQNVGLSYRISTIIACDIVREYAGGLAAIYKERKMNYLYNTTHSAEVAADKALKAISRDISEVLPVAQDHIERVMSLIYSIVGMDVEEQEKVKKYIDELKNTEA